MPIVKMNLKCEFSPMVAIANTVCLARTVPRLLDLPPHSVLSLPLTQWRTLGVCCYSEKNKKHCPLSHLCHPDPSKKSGVMVAQWWKTYARFMFRRMSLWSVREGI